jgi:hypothetical protein
MRRGSTSQFPVLFQPPDLILTDMVVKYCQNCGQRVSDKFYSRCGQKTEIHRITLSYLWEELFHFFTHIQSGFLFTSLRMLFSPGETIVHFINGKRKTYQSPVSYFLIWTAGYILLLYWIEITFGENAVIDYEEYFGPLASTQFAISHLSLVLTFIIPFHAFYLLLLVTRKKYNYFECLVAAIYVMGTIILLQFLFAVLALLVYLFSGLSIALRFSDILKAAYLSWFVYDFFKFFPGPYKWIRAFLLILFALGTFTVWRLYGVPQLVSWIMQ